MTNLKSLGVAQLLLLHASILDELRARGVVRSSNGPAGDYAALLFSRAFGWKLVNSSSAAFTRRMQKARGTRSNAAGSQLTTALCSCQRFDD